MPRNVRNFWIELESDGRRSKVATGPRAKNGGFQLTIKQRHQGDIVTAMQIEGHVHQDGHIILNAQIPGTDPLTIQTER